MTSVHVEEPIGSSTFARCVADEFDRGVLTITRVDDGLEAKLFAPGQWKSATVLNEDGTVQYRFEAKREQERLSA